MAARLSGSNGGGGAYALGQNADINVTPFVDILLVLLIIFMVAIPMATVAIKLDAPPPGKGVVTKPYFLSLQQDGRLISPNGETSIANLGADLSAAGKTPDDLILVRADADVPYGRFIALVGALHADGFMQVGMISETLSAAR